MFLSPGAGIIRFPILFGEFPADVMPLLLAEIIFVAFYFCGFCSRTLHPFLSGCGVSESSLAPASQNARCLTRNPIRAVTMSQVYGLPLFRKDPVETLLRVPGLLLFLILAT